MMLLISCVLSPSLALRLSCCCSFHLSPPSFVGSPGLWGITEHRGWSVQTQKAVQRRGAAGTHTIINWRLRAARLCFCRATATVNTAAYRATWRQINRGITGLRTATQGGIKSSSTEGQAGSERRSGENLQQHGADGVNVCDRRCEGLGVWGDASVVWSIAAALLHF